jgi:hypothetical protein
MASGSTQANDEGTARMQMTPTATPTRLGLVVVFNRRLNLRVPTLTAGVPGWPPVGRLSLTCLAVLAAVALVPPVLAIAALVGSRLQPGPLGVVWGVLAAATSVWVLYPQPQTGFRRLGPCPVDDVAAGDWIDDGWWARQVASRIPAPADSGPRWRLTFAEGPAIDLAEGEQVERLEPVGEVTTASCPLATRLRSAVAVVLLLWAPPLALPLAVPLVRFLFFGG